MVFQFKCCGIVNDDDYNQSHWRKEALGGDDLIYPLTCCSLQNANNFEAFLNPMVKNQDKCMSPDIRLHGQHRHTQVKTSPKGFSASKCDVGNWIFSKSWKFFENCFGDFLEIFRDFFWKIFW